MGNFLFLLGRKDSRLEGEHLGTSTLSCEIEEEGEYGLTRLVEFIYYGHVLVPIVFAQDKVDVIRRRVRGLQSCAQSLDLILNFFLFLGEITLIKERIHCQERFR